jgi:PAS domain S-box-containing protein
MDVESALLSRTPLECRVAPSQPGTSRIGLDGFAASAAGLASMTSVLDAVPVAMYATDAEGRIVYCNQAAAALFGSEPELGNTEWAGLCRLSTPDGNAMLPGMTPMQTALRDHLPIRGAEAAVIAADGSRTRVLIYATPLFDAGVLIGGVNTLVELRERDRVNYLEQRLAAIVECSEDAIISKDLNGTIATWNGAAERLFGYTAEEAIGKPITMLIPEDRQQEESVILNSIRKGRPVARYETVRQRKDGTQVPIALTVSPLRDTLGRIIGASKIARDITDQVRLREQQTLMFNEMSHRVKNILAVAGGLIGLSARSAESPKAMAKAVQERLGAYSKAHELTRLSGLNPAQCAARRTTVHTLAHAILAPYLDDSGERCNVIVAGEDISIDASATASLALVLHEFTTNAAKYGALSAPSGRITITCRHLESQAELVWQERGGPQVSGPPARHGFGSVLAAKTVEGQLGGSLHYDWQPEGVVIVVQLPSDRLVQA